MLFMELEDHGLLRTRFGLNKSERSNNSPPGARVCISLREVIVFAKRTSFVAACREFSSWSRAWCYGLCFGKSARFYENVPVLIEKTTLLRPQPPPKNIHERQKNLGPTHK